MEKRSSHYKVSRAQFVLIMIMIMIRYWKDSTQCWLHPGGGGTLKTKRGLITTNLVQKYN